MACNQCVGIESTFNERLASRELDHYHRKGLDGGTRLLVDELRLRDVLGLSLLDIGGGVGAIQHELFKAGISAAIDVDASSSYLRVAQEEAARLGNASRTTFHHGNFAELARDIPAMDIVTLDRVICCYPDMEALVRLSSERARKYYAVVFPRDGWLIRIAAAVGNFFLGLSPNPFRMFVHPTAAVDAIVEASGLKRCYYRGTGLYWQVIIYART